MYYHISILTKEQQKLKSKPLIKLDIKDKNLILNEIIIPYVKNEEFMFEGVNLNKESISQLIVKQSDISASEWRRRQEDKLPHNVIMFISSVEILKDMRYPIITSELIKEVKSEQDLPNISANYISNNKIFIVHGHDESVKLQVTRFVESLDLQAIILDEQPSKGNTIIEKIEEYSDVRYAIVLYTPCDLGGKDKNHIEPRARQNVIFEHGYMVGRLGRKNVCAILKDNIERPSDIEGIIYIPFNKEWKIKLMAELKAAGLQIDANKVI